MDPQSNLFIMEWNQIARRIKELEKEKDEIFTKLVNGKSESVDVYDKRLFNDRRLLSRKVLLDRDHEAQLDNRVLLDRYDKVLLELNSLQATVLARVAGAPEVVLCDILNIPLNTWNYKKMAENYSEWPSKSLPKLL